MAKVYLALGSNVGDSRGYIEKAIGLLGDPGSTSGATLQDIQRAPIYRSKAVGYTDQADFLNTAVSGQTSLSPEELLAFIKKTEQQIGRVERFRWGPREIDIDIIFYDDRILETADLTLPHPAFRQRDFVLRPLQDLDPQLSDPVSSRTVSELLGQLPADATSILRKVD